MEPRDLACIAANKALASYCILSSPNFDLAPHIQLLISKLEAVERGDIRRLMIFLPPRHGKSFLTVQRFPAWYLGRHPDRFVISASYGQELAEDFGREVRNLLADELSRTIFPECRLSEDSAAIHRFNTTAGGTYYAVGRGGPITGRGAHLLLIDDPIKDDAEARSESTRKSLQNWYSHVAYTRLQPDSAVVVIMTRWHEDDLAGWLLREHPEEGWNVVRLPAIAEEQESFRGVGEALWPGRFPIQVLEQIRTAIGGAAWAGLYQQRPSASEGQIFRRDWWRSYRDAPPMKRTVQSWDTAFKAGAQNDYSVCTTWGVNDNGYYLLSVWRERVEFPQLKLQLASLAREWKPNAILVEDKASGQSLIQELQLASALPVLPVKVDSDKVARAHAVTPLIEAGKVFLPEMAPWLNSYLDEMATFPTGLHDDAVDSTTQALNYLREPGEDGFMMWLLKSNETQQRAQEKEREKQHLVVPEPSENGGGGVREPAPAVKRESRL
jgi:predicted phage terminase large subunit-like protein